MTPELQTQIHSLLLTVLTGVVTLVGILLRNLINSQIDRVKNDTQKAFAQRMVAYAEQKLSDSVQKNSYVAVELSKKFPALSQTDIQHLIEEAVLNLQAPQTITEVKQ